jgi:hypothetical protein
MNKTIYKRMQSDGILIREGAGGALLALAASDL